MMMPFDIPSEIFAIFILQKLIEPHPVTFGAEAFFQPDLQVTEPEKQQRNHQGQVQPVIVGYERKKFHGGH
jgi:hypothetical protein